jgi:hypothetical protein
VNIEDFLRGVVESSGRKLEEIVGPIESAGGKLEEVVGPLPDGTGVAMASFPLPEGHWYKAKGHNVPPMPFRCGEDDVALRAELEEACRAAARFAVRAATMNGRGRDFDPDALVQNFVVGMLGYHTADGLLSDGFCNPDPVPAGFMSVVRDVGRESDELLRELRSKTSWDHHGEMLRLSHVMENLLELRLEEFEDLWDFLLADGFSQSFVDDVAKLYWYAACRFVNELPYRLAVTRPGVQSEYRLTSYLLRDVRELMLGEL